MAVSTVKWFNMEKGYGFISNPEGKDIFVHYTSIVAEGYRTLGEGDKVEYELANGDKGLFATSVKCLERKLQPEEPPRSRGPRGPQRGPQRSPGRQRADVGNRL